MPSVVILGLQVPFKCLWKKVNVIERPSCDCNNVEHREYTYCPVCGVRITVKKLKVYRSLLTGEETTWRNVHGVLEYLGKHNLDIYDPNPRGYTDDPVYIYFTRPNCYMEVNIGTVGMPLVSNEISSWMKDILGEDVWSSGSFGIWGFNKPVATMEDCSNSSDDSGMPTTEEIKAFLVPIFPRNTQ